MKTLYCLIFICMFAGVFIANTVKNGENLIVKEKKELKFPDLIKKRKDIRNRMEFKNFSDLKEYFPNSLYSIKSNTNRNLILITAIHGGCIEKNTEKIAMELSAEKQSSVYTFIAKKCSYSANIGQNSILFSPHLSSAYYDDPNLLKLSKNHDYIFSIHGHNLENNSIIIGARGCDNFSNILSELAKQEANTIKIVNAKSSKNMKYHHLKGSSSKNHVNLGKKNGVQIEVAKNLRSVKNISKIITILSKAIDKFIEGNK